MVTSRLGLDSDTNRPSIASIIPIAVGAGVVQAGGRIRGRRSIPLDGGARPRLFEVRRVLTSRGLV
ncbi:MAG TPA: hypothetical protein VIP51_04150, partial [Eoetvoesiella sp.]